MNVSKTRSTRLGKQLAFILELDRLKEVIRRTYIASGKRNENTAEHSWQLAIMALVLSEYSAEPVDVAHVMKLVLVHDIVEIDAGDTFAYDDLGNLDKPAREQRAADRLYGMLPDDQNAELRALWEEFEARETPEAKFANTLDRLIPLMHNIATQGRAWDEHGITGDMVLRRNESVVLDGSPELWEVMAQMIQGAIDEGFLPVAETESDSALAS